MNELLYADESYAVRGAIFEVYREMGSGFLEAVYQECLAIKFKRRNIPFRPQEELRLVYKGDALQQRYKADFVCFDKILVELKAVKELVPDHRAHLLNYLNATGMRLGLLVNFGSYPEAEVERMVL
jgi:GxxExxY protein